MQFLKNIFLTLTFFFVFSLTTYAENIEDIIRKLNAIESRLTVLEKATFNQTTSGLSSTSGSNYDSIITKQSIQITEIQGEIQKLTAQLERNQELGGEVNKEMLDFLTPLDDDTAFVDLAAYSLCKHTLRKQAMLEVQNLGKRANMLLDDLTMENDRLDLIKQALGGKQDEDLGYN